MFFHIFFHELLMIFVYLRCGNSFYYFEFLQLLEILSRWGRRGRTRPRCQVSN